MRYGESPESCKKGGLSFPLAKFVFRFCSQPSPLVGRQVRAISGTEKSRVGRRGREDNVLA